MDRPRVARGRADLFLFGKEDGVVDVSIKKLSCGGMVLTVALGGDL